VQEDAAIIHLTRAYGLLKEVESATDGFRRRAIAHSEGDSNEAFLEGMISAVKGNRDLKQQKGALLSDIGLAEQEIARASSLDPEASIETKDGPFDGVSLRMLIAILRGNIEVFWGSSKNAIGYYQASRSLMDSPTANYMLGFIHEAEYRPVEALKFYEQCLALDPVGEFSVSALRSANAMRNYKKKFRGSWFLFLILFIFFFPAAIIYFFVKRK
jgi:tetratricopeptide (TPR) repeat protein